MLINSSKRLLNRFGFDLVRIPGFTVERASTLISDDDNSNTPSVEVHMLWIGGSLSNLEKISILSFLKNGFSVKLWTYGNVLGVPDGTIQHDARTVLPENRIFKYKNGSYAGFANLFRYAVLSKFGGLWADTDVICLIPASHFSTFSNRGFLYPKEAFDL